MRIRKTKQESQLENELKKFNSLFTAEDFHKSCKSIGIATVYRFLKTQVLEHKLHTYICNRRTLYSKKPVHHCHFTCENCKSVTHFNIKELGELQKQIPGETCHIQLEVSGICFKCKRINNH